MELMKRMEQDSPGSIADFSAESRSMAIQVSDAISNGQDTDVAIEIARKQTYGLTPTQKEEIRLSSSGKEAKKERLSEFEQMVKDEFDPFKVPIIGLLKGAPSIPAGMQASYMANFNDFMALTNGNTEQASKLAFDSTKNIWGVTSVGGKRRFVQYPPEANYHVEGFDDQWIEDQMLEETEALGFSDAILGVDDLTSREDAPSYPILTVNDRGFMDVAEDESGRPLRFRPDFKETQEYRDLIDEPGKKLESAKERRAKDMERRANQIRRRINSSVFVSQGIPPNQRDEHLATEEGKADVLRAVGNMLALDQLDQFEAKQTLEAYGAGQLEDLAAFDVLVEIGKINANN
jgi:hypothetical protein